MRDIITYIAEFAVALSIFLLGFLYLILFA